MSINKMDNYPIYDSPTSVYKLNGYSLQELLSQFWKHINEVIEGTNLTREDMDKLIKDTDERLNAQDKILSGFIEWVKNEELPKLVEEEIVKMYEDGRLGELINETLLKEINDKVNAIDEKVDHAIIEINENLNQEITDIKTEINSYVINVAYPPIGLNPVLPNGLDQSDNLKAIIDYAMEDVNAYYREGKTDLNFKTYEIVIPSGRYVINKRIELYAGFIKLSGTPKTILDFKDNVDLEAIRIRGLNKDWNDNEVLYVGRTVLQDITIVKGKGIDSRPTTPSKGIVIGSELDAEFKDSTSMINLQNVNVWYFNYGIETVSNAWCIEFLNCNLRGNYYGFINERNYANGGEKITFIGGNIFNSAIGVKCANLNADIHFVGVSLDYCTTALVKNSTNMFFTNCHLEYDSNNITEPPFQNLHNTAVMNFDNCEIVCGGAVNSNFKDLFFIGGGTNPSDLSQVYDLKQVGFNFSSVNLNNVDFNGMVDLYTKINRKYLGQGKGNITANNITINNQPTPLLHPSQIKNPNHSFQYNDISYFEFVSNQQSGVDYEYSLAPFEDGYSVSLKHLKEPVATEFKTTPLSVVSGKKVSFYLKYKIDGINLASGNYLNFSVWTIKPDGSKHLKLMEGNLPKELSAEWKVNVIHGFIPSGVDKVILSLSTGFTNIDIKIGMMALVQS